MTDQEYEEIKVYCSNQRNRRLSEFKYHFARKEEAVKIKREITSLKGYIKDLSRHLERTTDELKLKRIRDKMIEFQDAKRLLIKKFEEL